MRFGETLQRDMVAVDGPLTVGDMTLMIDAAEQGLGLTYVYAQEAEAALAAGRLVTVLDDWCPTIPGFYLYYPSRKRMPVGLKAFVGMVQRGMGALPDA